MVSIEILEHLDVLTHLKPQISFKIAGFAIYGEQLHYFSDIQKYEDYS